jgi:hypothetical protein
MKPPQLINKLNGLITYEGGFAIDADGSPRAYGPKNTGLDYTANAGSTGNWFGIVTDSKGAPILQDKTQPYPGMYISPTALQNHSKAVTDPARYVDSEKINYIAVSSDLVKKYGVRMGDLAAVYCRDTETLCSAVCADVGPRGKYGEGSLALASQLGINANARRGGCSSGIVTVIFLQSHSSWPLSDDIIVELVSSLLEQAGGIEQFL